MNRRFLRSSIFKTALLLGAMVASGPLRALTIIHTNDVLGELEPCGCRSNPLGGMARQFNLLKRLKDQSLILLDGGDLLFAQIDTPPVLKKQSELQAQFLVQAMDKVHYDASVPGEKDFSLGLKVFEKLAKSAHFQFLAANLRKKSGGTFLKSHLIIERPPEGGAGGKPIKVGVFGLVGRDLKFPKELSVTDPLTSARAEVAALRKKVDYVIALTHEGFDADKILAEKVSGIDLVIGGHSQSFLQTPITVKSTLVFQSSFRNQYVGEIPLSLPLKTDSYTLAGLDAGYDSPAELPSEMDDLVKSFKGAIAQLNSAEAASEELAVTPKNTKISFQTFPRCAECHLKQFDFWRKTAHANALTPLVDKEQLANKECLTCHSVGLGDKAGYKDVTKLAQTKDLDDTEGPEKTLPVPELVEYLKQIHGAAALKSLIKVRTSDTAPATVRRTLGSLAKSWAPVQCENCHAPGNEHPFTGSYSKVVQTSSCLQCHTAERAPEWWSNGQPNAKLIEAKRAMVTCPAGELNETETE